MRSPREIAPISADASPRAPFIPALAGSALPEAEHDAGTISGDLVQMGDVLREANRLDEALAKYSEGVKVMEASQLIEPVKAAEAD